MVHLKGASRLGSKGLEISDLNGWCFTIFDANAFIIIIIIIIMY